MTRDVDGQPSGDAPRELAGILPQPGEIFDGKYRIERPIGQGAMAIVLEATHLQLEDRVAIKLLLPQWAADPEFVERFMREGRAATRIRSEHVVRVFDVGVTGAHPYLVMEYLDGSDLDQVIAQQGALPVELAVDYLLQACEAIAEAHARGVVHRDLKPANLFLIRRADGSACVKVLDFGISKATIGVAPDTRTTEPSTVMGSPHYMSPEQMLSSKNVDVRADIWALGAILHELLVASPPFVGETIAALSAAVLRDPAPPLTTLRTDVPPQVEAVVLRCLEKEPARRFANVAELAAALAECGSASAHASAERIARVLDAATGKITLPEPRSARSHSLPEPRSERVVSAPVQAPAAAGSLLASVSAEPPARARGRILGYVIAGVTFVAVAAGIVSMIARDKSAVRAAEEREHADAAAASVASVTTTAAASAIGSNVAPPGSATPSASPSGKERPKDGPAAAQASTVQPPIRPHARGPRRGPHLPPRGVPPLPDFPVPSADPEGEPSSRPIVAPPPTASAPAVSTALPTNPPLPPPSATHP
jgi:serine/threonine protein kinase